MAERETNDQRRHGLLTFVIVGGGPTGVELAGAIAEIAYTVMVQDFRAIRPQDDRIIWMGGGRQILPFMPESLSVKAEEALKRAGVEVMKNSPVTSVSQGMVMAGKQRMPPG